MLNWLTWGLRWLQCLKIRCANFLKNVLSLYIKKVLRLIKSVGVFVRRLDLHIRFRIAKLVYIEPLTFFYRIEDPRETFLFGWQINEETHN